jgi:hypothetical protein
VTVIKPPTNHVCRPEPGVCITPHRSRLVCRIEGGEFDGYFKDYEAGTTLICDECGKAYTADGYDDRLGMSAVVHRETGDERKAREKMGRT